jgi:hypothetical protein
MKATTPAFLKSAAVLAMTGICCASAVDAQNILTNPGFETAPFPTGWSNPGNASTNRAGLNGSTTAAFVPRGGYTLEQTASTAPIGTPASFSVDLFLAATTPGDAGKNSLEFQILYQGNTSLGFLRMGVTDLDSSSGGTAGDFWVRDGIGGTNVNLFSDAITYSTGVGLDGQGGTIHPYRVKVDVGGGFYEVSLSADGGTTFTSFSGIKNFWATAPTISNPTSLEIKLVGGDSGGPPANQGDGIFDHITIVPEPSSVGLALIGLLTLRLRRR